VYLAGLNDQKTKAGPGRCYNCVVLARLFLLAAASLSAADLIVDHVTVAGNDLKRMQAQLASVGIPTEFGGPHSNGATQMAIASFPDGSYLELIALQINPDQKALAEHYWSKQMLGNAGPTGWAVRSKDVASEVARLRTAGIVVGPPTHSGRQRPDGIRLDWETARVGEEPNGTFFPFLIRDFTPRESRAFPKGKPTSTDFSGVKHVVIAVRDLKKSVARYRQAYALPVPLNQDDQHLAAHLASFAGTPVILAEPLNPQSWIAQRIEQFGEGPCAYILAQKNGPATTRWLDTQKLGWHLGITSQ
jgi:hypothetical protein